MHSWNQGRLNKHTPRKNDICEVNLPVKVLMVHSDRIPDELDELDEPITYKEGLIMKVLEGQEYIYDNNKLLVIGNAKV